MIAVNNEEPPNALRGLTESNLVTLMKEYEEACDWDKLIELHMIVLNYQLLQVNSDHPQLIQTYFNLGHSYKEKKEHDKAVTCYKLARKIILQERSARDYQLGVSYDSLGKAHAENKEYDKALECFEIALKGFRNLQAQDKIGTCYNNIGETLRRKGEFGDAIGYLEEALEMAKQLFGKHDVKTAMIRGNLGKLHVQKGDFEKGLSCLRKAERIFLEWRDPQHPDVIKAQQWIAQAKKDQAEAAGSKEAQ